MMITHPRFREVWEEVNHLLDRRELPVADFMEIHENIDMIDDADGNAEEIVDLILWDRDRREAEAREDREMAEELARDWDAYNRRIAR